MATDYVYSREHNPLRANDALSHDEIQSLYQDGREQSRNISPLDPRRITPTLHASLVSEILNLRRHLESKDDFIDHLENTLQAAKSDNEVLQVRLAASARDNKAGQREAERDNSRFQELAADLIRDRDNTINLNQELRDKLDSATKKSRSQERDFAVWQQDWDEERQKWDNERRQMERRIHVTEERLRTVVEEMNHQQLRASYHSANLEDHSRGADSFKDSGLGQESEVASLRSAVSRSHHRSRSSISFSSIPRSIPSPHSGDSKHRGLTLADELDLDQGDPSESDDHDDEDILLRRRTQLAHLDAKARKILGYNVEGQVRAPLPDKQPDDPAILTSEQDERRDSKSLSKLTDFAERVRQRAEEMVAQILSERQSTMVSSSAQTSTPTEPQYYSMETQTTQKLSDVAAVDFVKRSRSVQFALDVPSIAIHPPITAPSSPKPSVLPPATRNAHCQTDRSPDFAIPDKSLETASIGVQTEEIRVDMRKFAPADMEPFVNQADHLDQDYRSKSLWADLLSAQDVQPAILRRQSALPAPLDLGPIRQLRSLRLKAIDLPRPVLLPSPEQVDEDSAEARPVRRSHSLERKQTRSVSPLSIHNEGDMDNQYNGIPSPPHAEDVFATRPLTTRRASSVKPLSFPMTVPKDIEVSPHRDWRPVAPRESSQELNIKGGHVNTSAIQRLRHSRTPSGETLASSIFSTSSQPPPIPVPARSSSRTHVETTTDNHSVRPQKEESPTRTRLERQASGRRTEGSVRKVQSASTMRIQKNAPIKRRRNVPALSPIRSSVYENAMPTQFLLPDNLEPMQKVFTPSAGIEHSIASSTFNDEGEQDAKDASHDATLVDAVASTMVGGWMWKYVGKRPSFGIHDLTMDDAKSGGVRHKRWVWLSPYEQTIMWSNKQPTSGAALTGKASRRLQVKSVLDVKDNSAPPKGEALDSVFDRSIVVLTPTRALKLTAQNRERHYLWLMALSFLANPSDLPPQIPRVSEAELGAFQARPTQHVLNPVIEKSIDKAQVRNFSDPVHQMSVRASMSKLGTMHGSEPSSTFSHPDLVDMPAMWPLESYNRHSRKRSNTGPSRFTPSVQAARGMSKTVSPALSSTKFIRARPESADVPQPFDHSTRQGPSINSPRSISTIEESPGTVRMTAFVDNSYKDGGSPVPALTQTSPIMHQGMSSDRPKLRARISSQLSAATLDTRRTGHVYAVDESRDIFGGF